MLAVRRGGAACSGGRGWPRRGRASGVDGGRLVRRATGGLGAAGFRPSHAAASPSARPAASISSSVDAVHTRAMPLRAHSSSASRLVPATTCSATLRVPRATHELADDLAAEALLVDAALAGDDELRGAHAARRRPARRAPPRRRGAARRRTPPTARPRGRRRRRSRARRAGRAAGSSASSSKRCSRRATSAASAPFCGANTRGASSNGVCTSHSTASRASPRPPPSPIASIAPRPPSVVALPPTATRISRAPAATAARISSPVPRVEAAHASRSCSATSPRPDACAISTIAVSPASAK